MSRAKTCAALQRDNGQVGSAEMPQKRPIFHAKIGADLHRCRGTRSIKQVLLLAERKHLTLTENTLRALEEGRTQWPDVHVLRAVAGIYGLDYEPLAWRFVEANYGVSPEVELPAIEPVIDPAIAPTARILEALPSALRTSVIDTLHTLGAALGIAPHTARSGARGRGSV